MCQILLFQARGMLSEQNRTKKKKKENLALIHFDDSGRKWVGQSISFKSIIYLEGDNYYRKRNQKRG